TENMMIVGEAPWTALSMLAGTSLKDEQEETVLTKAPSRFRLVYPQQDIDQFFSQNLFFYQDDKRTFFIEPQQQPLVDDLHLAASVSPYWPLQSRIFQQVKIIG